MKRFSSVVICVVALFLTASWIQANSQVDPEVGRRLSQQFKSDQQRLLVLKDRVNDLSMKRPYNKTYDYQIVSSNIGDCNQLTDVLRNEIYALNYDKAAQNLIELENLMRATKTILEEDASLSALELKKESVFDEYYAPTTALPRLRGPALRAVIASEISFAERVLVKTRVPNPSVGDGTPQGVNATPCEIARNQLVMQEVEMEKMHGYSNLDEFNQTNMFFPIAIRELRHLHYSIAHELANKVYIDSQNILIACSTSVR
jgi:hypothetical protein